uniref:Small nuclear ribonucleoprotein E n=1 Tax=Podarcis muralis TaxID=64176 RepID=A0A670IUQ7_PODMU
RSFLLSLCLSHIRHVWLYEQGFDEYMNLVLDDAEEIHSKTKSRKQLGRIVLKGGNITLLQSVAS